VSLKISAKAEKDLKDFLGKVLVKTAEMIVEAEQAEWAQGPPRSLPGQHLRMDSGHARDTVSFMPQDAEEAGRQGYVIIGWPVTAWYAPWWSDPQRGAKRRLGLVDLMERLDAAGQLGGLNWGSASA
jgi:hypothetical protein